MSKQHDNLYADVKKFFMESMSGKLTVSSVTILTRYAMEETQINNKIMTGSEKKELVMGVINAFIEDLIIYDTVVKLTNDNKQAIIAALALTPFLIDAAAGFAKTYHKDKHNPSNRCC